MNYYRCDLHIHSCLSPCAELDMSPRAIAEESSRKGLQIIAVCDHNSAENVGAAMRAGALLGVTVLAGMEICSREEVHTLALFGSEQAALEMQQAVYASLPGTNRPDLFGDQVVANEFDEVEGFNDRRLIGATQLTLPDIIRQVHGLGGLSIASHIDRPSYSILSQLGFIPPDIALDALEISPGAVPPATGAQTYQLLSFSDAHAVADIGRVVTRFLLEAPTLDEIRLALASAEGRRVGE
ncbi:MAG: hypothetical protein WCQ99_00275 [Pseudomonadota bacterium]